MRHRTSLLSGLPLLLVGSTLAAQEPPPPPPPQSQVQQQQTQPHPVVRQRLDVLMRGIALSPEQQSRVDSILQRHNPEIQRLAGSGMAGGAQRDTTGGQQDQGKNDEFTKALERQEKEIRDVLTSEQQATWDSNAEQLKRQKGDYRDQ